MKPFSVNPCIRTDKPLKNGKFPIHLRIRVMGEETKIPTGHEIDRKLWDSNKQLPKNNPLLTVIQNEKVRIETHLLTELATGGELSIQLVKDFYNNKRKIKPENTSFYDYYLKFVEGKRKAEKDKDTIRIYEGTYKRLKEFSPDLKIKDVDLNFIESFDDFLRDVKNNKDGGRENKHKNLRAVILDMINHDINIKNPYLQFKMPKAKVREEYLEFEELVALRKILPQYKVKSTKRASLQMFLLACYTGLRISDILDLRWSHIDWDKKRFIKSQIKTKDSVIGIIPPWAAATLLEFSNGKQNINTDKYVFEIQLCPQTVGRHLKEFIEKLKVNKRITFHTSRHTFGTLQILSGTDLLTVSKLLGHTDIKTTMVYFNDASKLIDNHANKSQIFSTQSNS